MPATTTLARNAKPYTPSGTPSTGPAKPTGGVPPAAAVADVTRPRPRRQLSREAIKAVQARMRDVEHGGRTFEWMLHTLIKRHRDLVDPAQIEAQAKRPTFPETCSKCIGAVALHSVRALRTADVDGSMDADARASHKRAVADMCSAAPCDAIQEIVDSVVAEERAKHGAFLLQDPQAIFGQVELQLVFDSPSTTRRMRAFKEQCPAAVARIKQFLCGPGFHSAPPKANNDDAWNALLSRLRFDAIRDNRTPIYTELSKHWKKRHTPFEQFAHFLSFRDSMPVHFTLNMLTHGQKPALVAALCGDTTAFVLLARLGFAIPSDVQWERTPFMRDTLDTRRHAVLRHLNTYFFRRQFKNPAPIVVQTLIAPPGPSGLHGRHGRPGGSPPPAPEPMPAMELPPTLAANHPAMRVWEPRPPRKSGTPSTSAPAGSRSPIHDEKLTPTLPDVSPAARPANAGSSVSSWANIARTSAAGGGGGSPNQTGGSLPKSNVATPAALPVPTPTPVHGAADRPGKNAAKTPKAAPADAGKKKPAPAKKEPAPGSAKATPVQKHADPAAAPPAMGGYAAAARAAPKPKQAAATTPASTPAKPAESPAPAPAAAKKTPKSKPATPAVKPAATGSAKTTAAVPKLTDAPELPSSAANTPATKPAKPAEQETPGKRKNAWGV